MTPLERILRRMIVADGPLPLDRYMALCLGHPEHGYYMTRDPFGQAGDFTTAPEISQIYGELIGVWCATQWQAMGSPAPVNLVELGPGRGTLMADALRATSRVAGFREAARVCLVETSPVLRRAQLKRLGAQASWFDKLEQVPVGSMIVIASEFFDALPVRQLQCRDGQWFERCVGISNEGELDLGLVPAKLTATAEEGAIIELSPIRNAVAGDIGARLAQAPGAALIIDYGSTESLSDATLQALRHHQPVGILSAPGESDLTAHVDFHALGAAMRSRGASAYGLLAQGEFLAAMGLHQRAAALRRRGGDAVDAAVARLAAPDQMGQLFKVMAATSPDLPAPYPFGAA